MLTAPGPSPINCTPRRLHARESIAKAGRHLEASCRGIDLGCMHAASKFHCRYACTKEICTCLQLGLLVLGQGALVCEDAGRGAAGLLPALAPGARQRSIQQCKERRACQCAARLQHLHACSQRKRLANAEVAQLPIATLVSGSSCVSKSQRWSKACPLFTTCDGRGEVCAHRRPGGAGR